jgi:hypothetical protein
VRNIFPGADLQDRANGRLRGLGEGTDHSSYAWKDHMLTGFRLRNVD